MNMRSRKYVKKVKQGSVLFDIFNYVFLGILAFLCLMPIINVLAISLSSSAMASAGLVTLYPREFTLKSYEYSLMKPQFITSFIVTIKRVALGFSLNMFLMVLTAYPLSMSKKELAGRNFYAWFMFFTSCFSGGMIPLFIVVSELKLMNTLWALVLPGAIQVWNIILMRNFFVGVPGEIRESAVIDGAGHFTMLFRLYLPLTKPGLAMTALFTIIAHWNEWFNGLIYMQNPNDYPLQTYLRSVLKEVDYASLAYATKEELQMLNTISDRTLKSAQIFIAALPLLLMYPFLQKHFVKGLMAGSVKG